MEWTAGQEQRPCSEAQEREKCHPLKLPSGSWLLGVGKREGGCGALVRGRCKARSINQRGEENLTVCVGLTKAFADTSLQLLEGHTRQALPSK